MNFAADLRESFYVGLETHTDVCGMGPNKWPPNDEFRAKAMAYFDICLRVCRELRRKLEICLGPFLGPASDDAFQNTTSLLGFNHYELSGDGFGIRPHQDDGMCTLLVTDGQPGLEYAIDNPSLASCRDDVQLSSAITWKPVPYLKGHWIVNLGTDLFRWTNNHKDSFVRPSKATLHRVVGPATHGVVHRYSMPFFYEPNLDLPDPMPPHTKRYEYLIQDAENTSGVVVA